MVFFKRDGLYYIDEIKTSEPRFEDLEPEQVELFFIKQEFMRIFIAINMI